MLAVAFAIELIIKQNPTNIYFDPAMLRTHFLTILQNRVAYPFPKITQQLMGTKNTQMTI